MIKLEAIEIFLQNVKVLCVHLHKQNPYISSFEPVEGPATGGTVVTIGGMYLDAGYEITAMIGSDCPMNR